jgi:aconitate hydratase
MLAAGLLARNAVKKGLTVKPWVKTSLAPGSKVVTDYFNAAGVTEYLDQLGFNLVGYGCTTCIGNSGPSRRDRPGDRVRASCSSPACCRAIATSRGASIRSRATTTSRHRRSSSRTRSPGRMDLDLSREPIGIGSDGPVFLRDIWPSPTECRTRSCAA